MNSEGSCLVPLSAILHTMSFFFFFLIMFVILVLGHQKTFSSRLNICMKLERSQRERAVKLVEDSGNNLKVESSMKYYHTSKTGRK